MAAGTPNTQEDTPPPYQPPQLQPPRIQSAGLWRMIFGTIFFGICCIALWVYSSLKFDYTWHLQHVDLHVTSSQHLTMYEDETLLFSITKTAAHTEVVHLQSGVVDNHSVPIQYTSDAGIFTGYLEPFPKAGKVSIQVVDFATGKSPGLFVQASVNNGGNQMLPLDIDIAFIPAIYSVRGWVWAVVALLITIIVQIWLKVTYG